jgi:hypothetical protein
MRAITSVNMHDKHGKLRRYAPGDWFQCGKHDARRLLAQGSAEFANLKDQGATLSLSDCGVLLYGGEDASVHNMASQYKMDVVEGEPSLPFSRTLIVLAGSPLRSVLVPVGFSRLEHGWQIAIPLCGDDLLACEIGTEQERIAAKRDIRNLVVPVYDVRAMFVARCSTTQQLIEDWWRLAGEMEYRLAFLRAFYKIAPKTCQLPAERWME